MSVSLDLNWSPDPITANMDSAHEVTQFVNSLSASSVNVTLSDPYMTGPSWAALFDMAAAYTNPYLASYGNILLPECLPGQNPSKDNCTRKYQTIDDPGLGETYLGNFAHILVKLWYEVKGIKFSLETYFRLQGFEISNGKNYPQVTLRGIDSQSIAFNQTLSNYQFDEKKTLEEALKEIVEQQGHRVSFCNGPEVDYGKSIIFPATFKERGVTTEEMLKKYIGSVRGNYGYLPVKGFEKKVSICTRANINQGCSVFYLGKGLFEGYSITGNVPPDILSLNYEYGGTDAGFGFENDTSALEDEQYTLQDLLPNRRTEKFKRAKKSLPFPQQFTSSGRFSSNQGSSGYVWSGPGPTIKNEKKEGVNLYGINVNGNTPIALLDGKAVTVSKDAGSINIRTNYFLYVCKKSENSSCVKRVIFQEVRNITNLTDSIEVGGEVTMGQELGKSTNDKPSHTRFLLLGTNSYQSITLSPELVWNYAVPALGLTAEEKKKAGIREDKVGGTFAGRVGNTGRSDGAHLHFQVNDRSKAVIPEEKLNDIFNKYVEIKGAIRGRGYKDKRGGHTYDGAIDYPADKGTPINLKNGATVAKVKVSGCREGVTDCGGGYGNSVVISTPEGLFLLAHLDSTEGVTESGSVSSGSRYGSGVQNGPAMAGVEIQTEFKGVPRALRIMPGRTILSLITDYDKWVEKGRPSSIDPGIWIPGRFSKWFIKSAKYNWSQGDLRVGITGVSDWGSTTSKVPSPSFEEYMKIMKFTETKDYYGYIRSLGDLCWPLGNGSTSCEVFCKEAEEIRSFLARNPSGSSSQTGFTPAQCSYQPSDNYLKDKASVMNSVMAALKSVGINTQSAYAGVLGNFSKESGFRTGDLGGRGCGGSPAYGIAQWCYERKPEVMNFCKNTPGLDCELRFMVKEIKEGKDVKPEIVQAMNNAKTASEAADVWNQYFERGDPKGRGSEAERINRGLKCQRVNNP